MWVDRLGAEQSHAAANTILTPSDTKAITRQRICLFIRKSPPQQIEKRSRAKVALAAKH
jgi:hypothetical protein